MSILILKLVNQILKISGKGFFYDNRYIKLKKVNILLIIEI
jgi:hypothetical protein